MEDVFFTASNNAKSHNVKVAMLPRWAFPEEDGGLGTKDKSKAESFDFQNSGMLEEGGRPKGVCAGARPVGITFLPLHISSVRPSGYVQPAGQRMTQRSHT